MRKRVPGQQMSYQNMGKLTQRIPHMLGEVPGLEELVCSIIEMNHCIA